MLVMLAVALAVSRLSQERSTVLVHSLSLSTPSVGSCRVEIAHHGHQEDCRDGGVDHRRHRTLHLVQTLHQICSSGQIGAILVDSKKALIWYMVFGIMQVAALLLAAFLPSMVPVI
jgi:hypothetical protein